jgi:integrase
MLGIFRERLPGKRLCDLVRKDLLNHISALKDSGKVDRTVYNHGMRIINFLKANGIEGLLRAEDKPKYDEKDVDAYDADQLGSLLTAATAEERITFEFFLSTGLRDQEVMYTTWKNTDFNGKVVKVRSKPEMGFCIKDKEERSAPVPDSLINSLAERRKWSTSMLLFPGRTGSPKGHCLRMLQKLVFRAGLNCGECITKSAIAAGTTRYVANGPYTSSAGRLPPFTVRAESRRALYRHGWATRSLLPRCAISPLPISGLNGHAVESTLLSRSSRWEEQREICDIAPCPQ